MNDSKIIVSLDYPDAAEALVLVAKLDAGRCKLKVGKELFTSAGPDFIEKLIDSGFDVFLDLKFHDIPNTVAKACRAASKMGVWMLNVHATGGRSMLNAAREAVDKSNHPPLLIAVTVLTSLGLQDIHDVGISGTVEDQVLRLASLAQDCALDGVVCSAKEVDSLRKSLSKDFKLVTPGIRPHDSNNDDQKRVMTPAEAITAGSNYLVIGRPITQANDPMQALSNIEQEIVSVSAS
ncbi:MAG: orotidine-5'-phosphate decarboxylase [Gammaproteobacteria bacterium]|nr:orotidine-5'-phosphate decarboxylase [Gammaproteobacteria bacterium]